MSLFSQLSESSSTRKRTQGYQVSDDEVMEQLGNIASSLIDITSSNQNIINRLESNEKQMKKLRKVVQSRNTANDEEHVISQSKVRNMIPKDLKDCIVDSEEEFLKLLRILYFNLILESTVIKYSCSMCVICSSLCSSNFPSNIRIKSSFLCEQHLKITFNENHQVSFIMLFKNIPNQSQVIFFLLLLLVHFGSFS
jgi:hypothetical protein